MDVGASERAQEGFADAELLAGMRAGNSAAFAALMRSNNQRLYRLARGFLRDDLEAEEAVHDGYVSAFTHLDGFRGGSSLATWLARIVSTRTLSASSPSSTRPIEVRSSPRSTCTEPSPAFATNTLSANGTYATPCGSLKPAILRSTLPAARSTTPRLLLPSSATSNRCRFRSMPR